MGSAFHQLCPKYSGTLTLNAPTYLIYVYIMYVIYVNHEFEICNTNIMGDRFKNKASWLSPESHLYE